MCMGGDGDGNGRLLAGAGSAQVAAPAGALLQVQDADGRRHRAEGESQLRRARPGLQVLPEIRGSNEETSTTGLQMNYTHVVTNVIGDDWSEADRIFHKSGPENLPLLDFVSKDPQLQQTSV